MFLRLLLIVFFCFPICLVAEELDVQILSSNPNFACSGDVTTLSALGGFETYLWSTGEVTPTIEVTQPGDYWLTVTNYQGCSGTSDVFQVIPQSELTANITIIGSTLLCPDETVTFQGDPDLGYLWSNGETSQSITVSEPGFYTLTIIDEFGCQSLPQLITVTFFDIEAPTVTAVGPFEFCGDTSLVLTADWNTEYNLSWSNGETGNSLEVTQSGVYYAITTNLIGCEAVSESFTVTAGSASVAEILYDGNNVLCPGESITLTAGNGDTFIWSTGETTQNIVVSEPGIYELSVFDENECLSAPSSIEFTQPELYEAALIPNGPSIFCAGYNLIISHNLPFFYDVVWQDGSTAQDTTVTQSGTFYIVGTDQDSGCMVYSDTIVVEVGDPFTPEITSSSDIISCTGEDSLTLTSTAALGYLWSTGSVEQSITINEDGPYWVTTVDDFGCTITSDTIYYEIDTTFTVQEIDGPQIVNLNTFYTYSYPVEPGNKVSWSIVGGAIDFPNEETISVYWETFDNAEICANYESEFGCFNETICLNIEMFTSIDNVKDDFGVNVSPNPSAGVFNIQLPNSLANPNILVYNSVGQQIEMYANHSSNSLDLNHLQNGIYLLRFTFDEFSKDVRVIIEE